MSPLRRPAAHWPSSLRKLADEELMQLVAGGEASASLREIDGRPELVVSGMPQPPLGKIYEVWLGHGPPGMSRPARRPAGARILKSA